MANKPDSNFYSLRRHKKTYSVHMVIVASEAGEDTVKLWAAEKEVVLEK